jgi:hypothetical protein
MEWHRWLGVTITIIGVIIYKEINPYIKAEFNGRTVVATLMAN